MGRLLRGDENGFPQLGGESNQVFKGIRRLVWEITGPECLYDYAFAIFGSYDGLENIRLESWYECNRQNPGGKIRSQVDIGDIVWVGTAFGMSVQKDFRSKFTDRRNSGGMKGVETSIILFPGSATPEYVVAEDNGNLGEIG